MKGILLAGGSGTRLHPATHVVSKQLLPVYDKPMVYYPLSTLMLAGVRDILLVSTPHDTERFARLLGDGSRLGINLSYAVQPEPRGIAQAFLIAERFLAGEGCALVLGDNVFHGHDLVAVLQDAVGRTGGATVLAYPVHDPERYGVIELDASGKPLSIEEKPARPKSRYAITGFYVYDRDVVDVAHGLKPSARGELEISDVNRDYLARDRLDAIVMGRGFAWLDTGTHEAMLDASLFIQTIEKRQGLKVSCPEEIAFRMGYIDAAQLERLAGAMKGTAYGDYLLAVIRDGALPR
jgi:glucose-1-phosphate thymidylyltransferase